MQNKQELGQFIAGAGRYQGDSGQIEASEGETKVGNSGS